MDSVRFFVDMETGYFYCDLLRQNVHFHAVKTGSQQLNKLINNFPSKPFSD